MQRSKMRPTPHSLPTLKQEARFSHFPSWTSQWGIALKTKSLQFGDYMVHFPCQHYTCRAREPMPVGLPFFLGSTSLFYPSKYPLPHRVLRENRVFVQ